MTYFNALNLFALPGKIRTKSIVKVKKRTRGDLIGCREL